MPVKHQLTCQGFCAHCNRTHSLPTGGAAYEQAQTLLAELTNQESLNIFSSRPAGQYSTAPLWGEARGKMFGVLECLNQKKEQVFLYAFSGQYTGTWLIPGWAPPLFDIDQYHTVNNYNERRVKKMSLHIDKLTRETPRSAIIPLLKKQRKKLSQQLMRALHALYEVHNFQGNCQGLAQALTGLRGIPTGTGDCCAPKLINSAATQGLVPLSIAEFYFGRENRSASRKHGHFYSSCTTKCTPLLGFMLCGSHTKGKDKR
ncbi:hypothetical protein [Desulfotalea psychrophila]|uniref:Uncharacterized protein n=1 Tax=Desulfotalea psychrophila (strain LSv54 / DSM 12343) TaxID=177439 RepID=Q6AIJ3_DESPS|nr:hypothetical protein [Desulfotalea psychrophila]CAG37837.1 unknown protein [Desulfotalea psychrophila LSv54]